MTILDSNIWIAYLDKNDSQHNKAVKLWSSLQHQIILPEYVLLEVTTILAMRVSKEHANSFLDVAQNNSQASILSASESFFSALLSYYQEQMHPHLSFVDVSLLLLSKTYTVYTFDTKLAKAIQALG